MRRVLIGASRDLHCVHLDTIPRNRTAIASRLCGPPQADQWPRRRFALNLVNGREDPSSLLVQPQLVLDPPCHPVLGTQLENL